MVWYNNWRGRSIATTIEDGLKGQVQEMKNKLCSRSGSHKYRWIPTSVSCTLPQIQIWFYRNTKEQYCWNTTYKKQNCQQTAQHATARTLLGIKEITTLGRSWEIFLKSWVNLRYGQDAVVESGLTMKNDRKLFFKRKKRWVRSVFTISHEGYDAQKWVPWRVLRSSFLALNRSIDTNTRKDWILWQVLYFSDELGDTNPLLWCKWK